jgi:hypothetical protein
MQVWVDAEGFPGKARERGAAQRPVLTLDQLKEVLVRVTTGADEDFALRLYGELAAYARGVRELWDLSRMNQELFKQEKLEFESKV